MAEPTITDIIMKWVALTSNILTIVASSVAIGLIVFKGKAFSSVFSLLLNYTYQLSLSEVKEKLERLNDLNANEPTNYHKIVNIFHDLSGQIKGNSKLRAHFAEQLFAIDELVSDRRRLKEPKKRALVSEIRERLRELNIKNFDDLVGADK